MNKNIIKKVVIFLVMAIILLFNFKCYADTGDALTSVFSGESGSSKGDAFVEKIIGPILSVVRIIAVGIAIIMLTYLGIKYMSAAPSEKANIKNQLITFVVGALLVAGATIILETLATFAQNIGSSEGV